MAVSPSGGITKPFDHMRTLLADCDAFQTWVNETTAADAKTHVGIFHADEADITLPHCVVRWPGGFNMVKEFGGGINLFVRDGVMDVYFEDNIPSAYQGETNLDDAALNFLNDIGAILDDLDDLAGTGTYLNVTSVSIPEGPQLAGKEEGGDTIQLLVRFTWSMA